MTNANEPADTGANQSGHDVGRIPESPAPMAQSGAAPIAATAIVVAACDVIFREDGPGALSLALLAALLGLAIVRVCGPRSHGSHARFSDGYDLVGLAAAPLIENLSPLSMLVATALLALTRRAAQGERPVDALDAATGLAWFALWIPVRLPFDLPAILRQTSGNPNLAATTGWIMPLGMTAIFAALFASANPVLADWLSEIDLLRLVALLDPARLLLWLFVALLAWPFLAPRLRKLTSRKPNAAVRQVAAKEGGRALADPLMGPVAVRRALVLFNALFLVQTLMDLAWLWGGLALPNGMSLATYAHRGAYPLVATALLAAGFVLVAIRPGPLSQTPVVVRRLVVAFVLQNIGLVASSILRLELYVSVYALTYLRVAAFLWMGLVAFGLAMIIVRMLTGRTNRWLVNANLTALALTLYVACFVNFAGAIGNWNVDKAGRPGTHFDAWYLVDLGIHALPAQMAALESSIRLSQTQREHLEHAVIRHRAMLDANLTSWRNWSARQMRLALLSKASPAESARETAPETLPR